MPSLMIRKELMLVTTGRKGNQSELFEDIKERSKASMLRKKDAGILKPFYLFKSLNFIFMVNYNLQDPGKRESMNPAKTMRGRSAKTADVPSVEERTILTVS